MTLFEAACMSLALALALALTIKVTADAGTLGTLPWWGILALVLVCPLLVHVKQSEDDERRLATKTIVAVVGGMHLSVGDDVSLLDGRLLRQTIFDFLAGPLKSAA